MNKTIVVFALAIFTGCGKESDSIGTHILSTVTDCPGELVGCEKAYGTKLGAYLSIEAYSNGDCTGSANGYWQCVDYVKRVWNNALVSDEVSSILHSWEQADRALEVESGNPKVFIFYNPSDFAPRETDILVYQNIDPVTCEIDTRIAAGHVSLVSGVRWIDGKIYLDLIEENLVKEPCDDDLTDARMRTVTVDTADGHYSIDSGLSGECGPDKAGRKWLKVIGWIRHPLAGIFGDTGWHDDDADGAHDWNSLSTDFKATYDRLGRDYMGWAHDNGGGPFVHIRNRHVLQDFVDAGGHGRALVYNDHLEHKAVFLVRDGFYAKYLGMEGTTGLPLEEESGDRCDSTQNFENGYMHWDCGAVTWHPDGDSAPEPEPEDEPVDECHGYDSRLCDAGLSLPPNCEAGDRRYVCGYGVCHSPAIEPCVDGRWTGICETTIKPATEDCFDGMDNDCDSYTDCADASCSGMAGCEPEVGAAGEPEEDPDPDSDGDGDPDLSDCADFDALRFHGSPESCNYLDDDCDGITDEGVRNLCNECGEEPPEICGNLRDDDCDGVVDGLDDCPPDRDGDGTLDASDNCPDTYNLGQSDIDGDGLGDVCDPHDDRALPPEVCDGADNDGDGIADDGYECVLDSWSDCDTECGSIGREHCAAMCTWSECFKPVETCWNDIDDDCDSWLDEDCGSIGGGWCYGASVPIANPSAEEDTSGWNLEVFGDAEATLIRDCSTSDDGACSFRVVISRPSATFDILLSTELFLVEGQEYQILFRIKSRDIWGEAAQALVSPTDEVRNAGVWKGSTSLTNSWEENSIRFLARNSLSGHRLLFGLGSLPSGEFLLDYVRMKECP